MISVVIITYNEEDHIAECINSAKSFAKEIIVVDAHSTDQTVALAENNGAIVFLKKWNGYGAARNHGANAASHDWIFSLDADERCDRTLGISIRSNPLDVHTLYSCKRINIYRGQKMKYGMLAPEWKTRLYHRSHTLWDHRAVHEQLSCTGVIKIKKLKGELTHYAFDNKSEHRAKLKKYAQLSAFAWQESTYMPNLIVRVMGPPFHFFKTYILKLGILEGQFGIETSLSAYYYSAQKIHFYLNTEH